MTTYNGHKNWNHWNVSLWINNDEMLYKLARNYVMECRHRGYSRQDAAKAVLAALESEGLTHTPDGAPYSVSSIRAAMVGM